MSLSDDLRNELAAIEPRRDCCRRAELSGLAHSTGSVHLRGRGAVAVHLDLPTSASARRAFGLLRGFGVTSEIRTYRRRAFDRATRYQLHVDGDDGALRLLRDAGVLTARLAPLERPPRRVVGRACCRAAYLRGALLGAGSLSAPALHLEVRAASRAGAEFVAALAARAGATLALIERDGHAAAYAKGREAVEAVLAAAGADDLVLHLEERAVVGATRATANRLANADHANLVRTSRAAHEQLEAVRRLEASRELDRLPAPLHEIALLRRRHPTLPVAELARRCEPPVSKAAAHRRLRRLVRRAER